MAYNPRAIESLKNRQMDGDEPVHRMLRARQAQKEAELRAVEAPNNVVHAEHRFGKSTVTSPEQVIQADTAEAEAVRAGLQKPELSITNADFFVGSDIEWLNTIPSSKIGRINEVLATLGVPDIVSFDLPDYASVEEARKDLVFTWNQLLQMVETDMQALRSTPQIITRRSVLSQKVRALVQDIHRRETELAQAPNSEVKSQGALGVLANKFKKAINW